ncbi:MAG: hypothetical protein MJE12_25965 [Alphaproteobacteria bacterium]|nr:hypothetical protein [Alphaproteobacteria bacterium]
MPYDGLKFHRENDPVLGRLHMARQRLADRRHWISGKYFEENAHGYQYCVLGAISTDPYQDGCMEQDADGRRTVVWLARHIAGVTMSFEHAARVIYNINDGNAALEQVGRTVLGLFFMAKPGRIDGHARILNILDLAIAARTRELARMVEAHRG